MKKVFEMTANGITLRLEASYKCETYSSYIPRSDGWEIPVTKLLEETSISIFQNGNEIGRYESDSSPSQVLYTNPEDRSVEINCTRVRFNPDSPFILPISQFLISLESEVMANASPEMRALKKAKEKDRIDRRIKECQEIIERGREQSYLPSYDEIKKMQKKYNDLHNEGGEGYIPKYISKEAFKAATRFLIDHGITPKPFRDTSQTPARNIVLTAHSPFGEGHTTIWFYEGGWEVIENTIPKGGVQGYLHVDDSSPDFITDELAQTLREYWAYFDPELPGLGATPQSKYSLNCAEYAREQDIPLA